MLSPKIFINGSETSSHVDLVHESKTEQHCLPLAFLSLAFAARWGGLWLSEGENQGVQVVGSTEGRGLWSGLLSVMKSTNEQRM